MTVMNTTALARQGQGTAGTDSQAAARQDPPNKKDLPVLHPDEFGSLKDDCGLLACLRPLLDALNWSGTTRQIAEALPHHTDTFDTEDLQRSLAHLGFTTHRHRSHLNGCAARFAPFLFVPDDGPPLVVKQVRNDGWDIFDSGCGYERVLYEAPGSGTAFYPQRAIPASEEDTTWLSQIAPRFRGLVRQMVAISLITGLLGLATPLFIMAIYDNVIGSRAAQTLPYLAGGLAGAITLDGLLRLLRARLLAHIGGRIDSLLGAATFHQVLYLPLSSTQNAPVGTQLARLKQFETLRDFFTGPLASVVLDLPTILLFVIALWFIAAPVAWIPLVLLVLFALAAIWLAPLAQRAANAASRARARKQQFLIETLSNMATLRAAGVESHWSARFSDLAAESALASRHSQRVGAIAHATANSLMLGAGVATLAAGTLAVMAGNMTVGALVAAMAIVWRMLTPLQTGFIGLTKLQQLRQSLRQFNQLMRLKRERDPVVAKPTGRAIEGGIRFNRVGYRPAAANDPALLGVSFQIAPGELVAITGPGGAGKSSVLDLVAALVLPQAGAVELDGVDLRQHDPGELRRQIGYLPQGSGFLHGTIAQNLRLANPLATRAELERAAEAAAVRSEIEALPDGFDTRLTDSLQQSLSAAFAQKLLLARTYVTQGRILLLDDPAQNLDMEGDRALCEQLRALRGQTTILFTTQRPSHMALADQVLVLDRGQIAAAGPPETVATVREGR